MTTSTNSHSRQDLYAEVTATLIRQIERDPGEPKMPWRRSRTTPLWMPKNAQSEAFYRGINILMLWAAAEERAYHTPLWGTYKQWQELGAQVRGGEKGVRVVKYGEYEITSDRRTGEDDDGRRLYLKGYTVFNAAQVDNFALPEPPPSLGPVARIEAVKTFLAHTQARVDIGGERAFYRPSTDTIHMPDEGLFTGTDTMTRSEAWHAVELHEHAHWTSHKSRCNRELGRRFGDKEYIAEELIAEIASAQLCALLGVTQDVRLDHAQYLAHWLTLMKADPKAIFTAATEASRAVDYLVGLQPPAPDATPLSRFSAAKREVARESDDSPPGRDSTSNARLARSPSRPDRQP